jgi:hypothetical protein
LSSLVEVGVVATAVGSVSINVLEFVLDVRLVRVEGEMLIRLNDLSFPWLASHEALSFSGYSFEEIVISAVFILAVLGFREVHVSSVSFRTSGDCTI